MVSFDRLLLYLLFPKIIKNHRDHDIFYVRATGRIPKD